MKNFKLLIIIVSLSLLYSCAAKKPYYREAYSPEAHANDIPVENIDYELFLVGDIGTENNLVNQSDIVDLIKSQLRTNSKTQSVVFLGNSFSESGIPDQESPDYARIDRMINDCITKLKDNTDKVYFIPGNTEWYDGHDHTVTAVQSVEDYVQSKVNDKNIFVPSNGCGEPKVVKLTDDLLLLLIDSQWVLQGDASGERKRSGCDVDDELQLVTFIQQTLSKNKNKNVIIAAHHPVHSNGKTGGNYNAASHLLPLPILGSVITGVRKIGAGQQKFGHPQYEAYRSAIDLALSNFEGVIHTAAHDKNLQYHEEGGNHYIVSGSGANVDFVRKGGTADFALMKKGFTKITHTKDLELWLEFYVEDENNPNLAKSVYKKRLYKKEVINFDDKTIYKDLADYPQTVKTKASETYEKGKFGLGKTYRNAWGTEVDAPVLLLDNIEGGVRPVQQGGGFQTKSLRLENADGRQWVVRTIDKDVTKVVPPALRNTFVKSLVQDGISAAHPYAAFAIPALAEAAQIYHANPRYVWLPNQKALGDYNTDFANKLYLFEERPGGNMEGHQDYGGAKKSINTPELIEKLAKNHKHVVDQEYVLRARMFDLLIGDWDRHDDQWRWGVYEDGSNSDRKVYRAIPRDRDQAFFKNDGFLNYLASRPYFNPQLNKFEDGIKNISGLAYNARHFDRHFLSQLNEESFINAAKLIQANVTDEVINQAFSAWPKEIYDNSGQEIVSKLKSRRADLVDYAKEFYQYLTKEVTVVGTNSKNVFDITSLANDQLQVIAYHLDDGAQNLIWSRTIDGKDCDELRIFGLKKADVFNFHGDEKSSVKVRLVGGSGEDVVNNGSTGINVLAYDRPDGMQLAGNSVKSKMKDQDGINSYDRLDWKINRLFHFPIITFYTDEGIGLSYNVWWQKNGFRKNPYQSNHMLSVGYFASNSAIVGRYSGHWTSVFGPSWDFKLGAVGTGPTFTQFFYGLGNEFVNFEDVFPEIEDSGSTTFHIVRGTHLDLNPEIIKNFGNNKYLSINPSLEFFDLDDNLNDPDEPRFIFLDEANRTALDFEGKLYAGLGLHYSSDRINNPIIPTRGYKWTLGADFKQSLSDSEFTNLTFSSNVVAYIPFSPTHKVVLATNIGGAYTFGDYEFFHANYLSNQSRLRGFKTNRFAGDGIVYHATDLRIKLLQGNGGLRSGLGIFGSFDYGRAFLEDEDINTWHTSFGGGIYITPLNMLGFKLGYYVGDDDTQITIGGALAF